MKNTLFIFSVISFFIASCSTSNVSGKYALKKDPSNYIELKSDNTFYTEFVKQEAYSDKKTVRVTGKYTQQDKEIILTSDSGIVKKMVANGQNLTDVDTKTVFEKQ